MKLRLLRISIFCILLSVNTFAKNYKGAEIYSKTAVKYGRFEMSMKAGQGSGILSTFFLYKGGSEQAGAFWEEIDLEIFGKNSAKSFQSNIITDGVTGSNKMSEKLHTFTYSLADTFHIYRIEWTPTYVAWFIDNKELRRDKTTQVATLTNAESIRFNAWISGSATWAGAFNPAVLPQYQVVDWLKYSSYVPAATDSFKLEWTDDFNTFNTQRWAKANWTFDGNLVDFSTDNAYVKDGMLVLALTNTLTSGLDTYNNLQPAVYPNPAKELLYLNSSLIGRYDSYTIYSLMGAVVKKATLSSDAQTIPVNTLKSGMYSIRFNSKSEGVSFQFVKQ
ncbi:MAG: family 16 glycosylhydrolase [Methylococcaceae bacterium]|nr:family 16 glycosylhydrolase [Prolixibacteraceae bacterium]